MFSLVSRNSAIPVPGSQRYRQLDSHAPKCNKFHRFEKLWADACVLDFLEFPSYLITFCIFFKSSFYTIFLFLCALFGRCWRSTGGCLGRISVVESCAWDRIPGMRLFVSSVIFNNGVSFYVRPEVYVRCYTQPPGISSTGCMHDKKSNTRMLCIFETQEPYVSNHQSFIFLFWLFPFFFFGYFSLALYCPRTGFGRLAKRLLAWLIISLNSSLNTRKVRLVVLCFLITSFINPVLQNSDW